MRSKRADKMSNLSRMTHGKVLRMWTKINYILRTEIGQRNVGIVLHQVMLRRCRADLKVVPTCFYVLRSVVWLGPAVFPLEYWDEEGLLQGVGVICLVLEARGTGRIP